MAGTFCFGSSSAEGPWAGRKGRTTDCRETPVVIGAEGTERKREREPHPAATAVYVDSLEVDAHILPTDKETQIRRRLLQVVVVVLLELVCFVPCQPLDV